MVDMRVTDVARLGVLWRSGRSRADLIRGVVMLGSLAVATGGAIALASELPAWRGRQSVTEAARLIDAGDYASAIRTLLGAVAAAPRDARSEERRVGKAGRKGWWTSQCKRSSLEVPMV